MASVYHNRDCEIACKRLIQVETLTYNWNEILGQ